jgi:hypothetical protein
VRRGGASRVSFFVVRSLLGYISIAKDVNFVASWDLTFFGRRRAMGLKTEAFSADDVSSRRYRGSGISTYIHTYYVGM